jgi:lipoyl(octanoyl) transferase
MSSEVETSLTVSAAPLRQDQTLVRDSSTSVGMTKKLVASLTVFHDIDSRTAALNMAIDEVILETATLPTIRFYRWAHPALSFGYFGKFADVEKEKRDLVRRWTGGGIVFHGDDLTYSIVIPASDPAFSESSMSIYEKVHAAIRDALGQNNQFELADASTLNAQRSTLNGQCFANPVRADVLLNGRKIAGAAQRRTRRGLLQQGSIQDVDLAKDFEISFASQLSDNCAHKTPDDRLLTRAREIADQKYATAAWLRRY